MPITTSFHTYRAPNAHDHTLDTYCSTDLCYYYLKSHHSDVFCILDRLSLCSITTCCTGVFHHLLSAGVLGLVAVWIASKGDVIVRRSGQTGQVGWENVASCDNEMTPPEDLDSML